MVASSSLYLLPLLTSTIKLARTILPFLIIHCHRHRPSQLATPSPPKQQPPVIARLTATDLMPPPTNPLFNRPPPLFRWWCQRRHPFCPHTTISVGPSLLKPIDTYSLPNPILEAVIDPLNPNLNWSLPKLEDRQSSSDVDYGPICYFHHPHSLFCF